MTTAVFADLHDNLAGLTAVLADAAAQGVDDFVFLGDAGHTPRALVALQVRDIPCTFGNWEVSGLARLPAALADWVGRWPARIRRGAAVFCHATPDMPPGVVTTASAAAALHPGVSWSALFPRLHRDETARWQAFAWLETHAVQVAFHGHTHVQMVHAWEPGARPFPPVTQPGVLVLQPGRRYIVGVGSAGAPDDGPHPRYAIYDAQAGTVTLRRLA